MKRVDWLWKGRIPKKEISVISGFPGTGKSAMMMSIIASITGTRPWPDGTPCGPGQQVLYLVGEDQGEEVLAPRGKLANVDNNLLRIEDCLDRHIQLTDLADVRAEILNMGNLGAVIFDPLGHFIPESVKTFQENQVRSILSQLTTIATRTGAAVIVVMHHRKAGGDRPGELLMGSGAFEARPRSIHQIIRDKSGRQLHLAHIKSSYSKRGLTLPFTLESEGLKFPDGETDDIVKAVWGTPVDMTAEEILGELNAKGRSEERVDPKWENVLKVFEGKTATQGRLVGEYCKQGGRKRSFPSSFIDSMACSKRTDESGEEIWTF